MGPLWNYKKEDDTSCFTRKGPDNQAALAAMLMDLYKGEEEDFARLHCRDGFSMYNPVDWVSLIIQHLFYHWGALTEYSGCFKNSHGGR